MSKGPNYRAICPICKKPVAELVEYNFAGGVNKIILSGIHAQKLMLKVQNEIVYSVRELNYKKFKSKPLGWKYGMNTEGKNGFIKHKNQPKSSEKLIFL